MANFAERKGRKATGLMGCDFQSNGSRVALGGYKTKPEFKDQVWFFYDIIRQSH